MDLDSPTDLIHKSQIGFRQIAGLSSFNPNDTTLPSLPTVAASISAAYPSPSNLRCKFCKGKLLRDLQSLICIYCGEFQKNDVHPDPIAFKSTIGYSWLLQSLNFNGSERVGSLAEGIGINGAQSPAEDEATLSELLDLKITWRDQPKKSENLKTSERNSSLNLDTADVDDFFIESKRSIVSDVREELPGANKNEQNKALEVKENYNAVDDTSSNWNAEFQFADAKITDEIHKSAEPFVGSEADMSFQMDSVFGQKESFSDKKLNNDSDLFRGDLFANVSSATIQQAEKLDSDLKADADEDWFGDGNWQKIVANNTAISQQADQLDLFDDVNDGPSRDSQNDSSADWFKNTNWQKSGVENTAVSQQADQLDFFGKVNDGSSQDNRRDSTTDWFGNSDWQKSGAGNTAVSQQVDQLDLFDKVYDESSHDDQNDSSTDWFENTSNTATIKNDDLLDSKPQIDSVSSRSLINGLMESEKSDLDNSDKQHSDPADWFQNSQRPIGSSSSTNIVASKDDDDDGFDEWNDFTSSTGKQDSWKQSSNEKNADGENTSESILFLSTVDSQEVNFGNFFQSDPFSGLSSNKDSKDTHAVYDIFSNVSTASRNAEARNSSDGPKNDEITLNPATSPKNDVQMLLSQMHDLSFMLKNELSIPSKPNDIDPSHS